jgi:hypothetical protein
MGVVFYLKNERQRNLKGKVRERKTLCVFLNDLLKIFHLERSEI